MNIILKRLSVRQLSILAVLTVAIGVYGGSLLVSAYTLRTLTDTVTTQVLEQEARLISIAEMIANNEVDETAGSIITDCPVAERTQFDVLLGTLDKGLSKPQLLELERLFRTCGDFFAKRKVVMASQLAREVAVYESYGEQLATLRGESVLEELKLETWHRLVEEEQKQGIHFMKLVELQGEIITALLAGASAQSDEIKRILTDVSEVQGVLIVANRQAATVRTELITQQP